MGIIAESRFAELLANDENNQLLCHVHGVIEVPISSSLGRRHWNSKKYCYEMVAPVTITAEAASELYASIKKHVMERGRLGYKDLRPWEMDSEFYSCLDRSEPWWGFEFETGYSSQEARSAVIEHAWDTYNGVVFDGEGEGNWCSEITFTPQEVSKFVDGTAQASQFIQYLNDNPSLIYYDSAYEHVGTHLNISHPEMTSKNYSFIASSLNHTLHMLAKGDRDFLFGREDMYGGFFTRNFGESVYLEGKLFRTTYSKEVYDRYVKVALALTECIAMLSKLPTDDIVRRGITNLRQMVTDGEAPILSEAVFSSYGEGDGWYVSGETEYDDDYYEDGDRCDDPDCGCNY